MSCSDMAGSIGTPAHHVENTSPAPAMEHEHCGTGERNHDAGAHGKCSQCASCCVGAAAAPTMSKPALPPGFSASAIAAIEPAMTIHFPAALERPPRRRV